MKIEELRRKMVSKKDNSFLKQEQYTKGIAQALREELGSTHQAVKTLMKIDRCERKDR
jgi:hypothetical protein